MSDLVGYALSPQQESIWHGRGRSAAPSASVWAEIAIAGDVERARLRTTLESLVARYEILRTHFIRPTGMAVPLQVVDEQSALGWAEHDLQWLAPDAAGSRMQELREQAIARVVDLERGPMLSADVISRSNDSHTLLLTAPALCLDGASLLEIAREGVRDYVGSTSPTAESASRLQYADVASWLNEVLEDEQAMAAREYWRLQAIAGARALELAGELDRDAPYHAGHVERTIDLAEPLAMLARRAGVSTAAVAVAAWHLLLWRLTGASHVSVAMMLDGRPDDSLTLVRGPLARLVPIVAQMEEAQSVQALLEQMERLLRTAHQSQEYCGWQLAAGLRYGFAFESRPAGWAQLAARWEVTRVGQVREPQAALLHVTAHPDVLALELSYDRSALRATHAAVLLNQYASVLSDMLRGSEDRPIDRIDLLGAGEPARLLDAFARGPVEERPALTVLEMFHEQVRRRPGQDAVIHGAVRCSYAALDRHANAIAGQLSGCQVGAEHVVGILLADRLEMLAAMLGVWKAGAAFLPLDANDPAARRLTMLRRAAVRVVLTHAARIDEESGGAPDAWQLVAPGHGDLDLSDRATGDRVPAPGMLAYVMFTSGSTGEPKGVMVEHGSLANHTRWDVALGLGERERVLFRSRPTFDASVREWLLPLVQGGVLVMADADAPADGRALLEQVRAHQVTTLQLVPTLLRAMIDLDLWDQCHALERILVAGEALEPELIQRASARIGRPLLNSYGPTEATIDATSAIAGPGRGVSIGRPLLNARAYVLRDEFGLAAIGEPGEIFLGGAILSRGYIGNPRESAARFVPDPWGDGTRLYRTGDRARWRDDGEIEYLGRLDGQVKVRGQRIEIAEVERAIQTLPGVAQVAVAVRPGRGGERQLVAYLELAPGADAGTIERARAGVRRLLPEAMCPSLWVPLPRLPRTTSGKLDRRALPDPTDAAAAPGGEHIAPRTPLEQLLAEIWAAVLHVSNVGVTDNFFELGGDSILGIQIVVRARQAGVVLSPRRLFQHQTIAELVEVGVQTISPAEPAAGAADERTYWNPAEFDAIASAIAKVTR